MHKALKIFFLAIILVIPVLVFLFLKGFGSNYYTLPYYNVDKVGAGGDTTYIKAPDTEYLSFTGEKLTVLSIVTSPCGVSCRERLSQLSRVYDTFQDRPNIQLVTLGASDLGHDLFDTLKQEYQIHSDAWKWELLNKDTDIISALSAYRFHYWPDGKNEPEHISRLILFDADGYYRGYYNGQDLEDVDRLILELRVLIQQISNNDIEQ